MATTVNDLTDAAYLKCGLRSPTLDEDTIALDTLNNMLSLWGADFLTPYVTRESFDLIIGQAEYTIGSGAAYDFDTVRPISIANVYLESSDGYSYSVIAMGPKEYNRIGRKAQDGRPTKVYYVPEYPIGKLIFNKETDVVYTAYFEFWKAITEFEAKTSTVSLPLELKEAIIYNLAIRLAENNAIDLPRSVITLAVHTYNLISRLSSINQKQPPAVFDFSGGPTYNIITDE